MAELGNHHSSFPSEDNNAVDSGFVLGPFGTSETGTITELHMRARSDGFGYLRPLIYASDGSDPGALLSTLSEQTISGAAAWRDWTGLSIAFTAPIYIGFWQGGGNTVYYQYNGTGAGFYKDPMATYHATDPAPDPWPKTTDTPVSSQAVSIYVVYTAGGNTYNKAEIGISAYAAAGVKSKQASRTGTGAIGP